jgi:hypothetical protein
MADDYVKDFVRRQKDKAEQQRQEQEQEQARRNKQAGERLIVQAKAPVLWNELRNLIKEKVDEANRLAGGIIVTLLSQDGDEVVVRGTGYATSHLRYSRGTHIIEYMPSATSLPQRFIAAAYGNDVQFCDERTHVPVTANDIVKTLFDGLQ